MAGDLLITGPASRRLGVSQVTVNNWIKDDRLPVAERTGNGRALIRVAGLDCVAQER